ncbi:MAG: sigma 54-interacting transcriptional regulator [Candidatus Methylumidiphilus sp.]
MTDNTNPAWLEQAFAALPGAAAVADLRQTGFPVVYANPAFSRLTGHAQVPNVPLAALCADEAGRARLAEAFADGQETRIELRSRRADGSAFDGAWAIAAPAELPGLAVVLLADTTAQRQALAVLAEERDRLLGFIEYAPLGMIALDWVISGVAILNAAQAHMPIIHVNAAFEKLTGYSGEEAVGRPYGLLFKGDGNQAALQHVEQALAQRRELRIELRSYRKDGSWFWTELALSPVFDEHGRLTHYLGVQTDISERRQAEENLRGLSEELRRSRDNLVSILNEFPNSTLIVEADGTVAFASASCLGIIGVTAEQAGQHWRQVFPIDKPAAEALRHALAAPAASRKPLDLRWQDASGQARWVECVVKDDPRDPARRLVFLEDVSELRTLRETLATQRHGGLVGDSEPMREVNRLIGEIAKGDWTVLIEGETGAGKERVAQGIHEASPRRAGPFIAVNSAGLSESLLASQLFGHKKGAFTGASADQAGFFEAASGGTIFLDEIGDLPLPMQAALLRVLQEHEVTRLGETRARRVDVRVVAATHKDLAAEARAGRFREDLMFRLRVARVLLPPLRERKTDIPLLVEHFLKPASRQAGKNIESLSAEAWQSLLAYDWPGNVRELRACVDFASICCQGGKIQVGDLPPEIRALRPALPAEPLFAPEADERERILAALKQTRGKRLHAAKLLGISRATFYRRLKELGLGEDD